MVALADLAPDVFVSYAHEDKPFAHRVAAGLEEEGCRVWVDDFELRVGDSLTERISQAAVSADFAVVLVSPASVESKWCKRELQIALATGLSEGRTLVLPVRLGKVKMPPSLADLRYLNADPADADAAVEMLATDMARHADELEQRRKLEVTRQEWAMAVEPAHDLDDLLGDMEQQMSFLWSPDVARRRCMNFQQAFELWLTRVDKWAGGDRLPGVLQEVAVRFEGLLELALHLEPSARRHPGVRRRLDRIVGAGLIETRTLISSAANHPEVLADSTLDDCSIPERDELFEMARQDPTLVGLRERIVPTEADEPEDEDLGSSAKAGGTDGQAGEDSA